MRDATLRYEKFVMAQLDDAAQEALEKMRPVKMAYGYGESFVNMIRNQDYTVESEDGKLETYGALGIERTRALPGYIEASLEKHTVDMFEKVKGKAHQYKYR